MGHGKQLCKRCREFKWLKARGLCETCWKTARGSNFAHYPLAREMPKNLVCRCISPIPEHLTVWDAVQCKRCGKKVLSR